MRSIASGKYGALVALSLLASNSYLTPNLNPGTPDECFNPGGPQPGLNVVSMSPFLNLGEGIGIQIDHGNMTLKENENARRGYKIIVGGDAVQAPNPLSPNFPVLDGFIDERGWSLTRLNEDGSVDLSFGPNGNGKAYLLVGTIASDSAPQGITVDRQNRINYAGIDQLAASASYLPVVANLCTPAGSAGITQNPNAPITCGSTQVYTPIAVTSNNCGFAFTTDPATGNPYGQEVIAVARFLPNGSLDNSFGVNGIFTLNPYVSLLTTGSISTGDVANASVLDNHQNILVSGYSSADLKGCGYVFPLLVRVNGGRSPLAGTLDTSFNGTGYVVEGSATGSTLPDIGAFTDYTVSPPVNLGFAQYEASAVYNNGGHLHGYIVAVGDGNDLSTSDFWPLESRIIASRYSPDGRLDTSFGVNGRMLISAQGLATQKQLLARTVAIDEHDNIYIGGDIADNGSGPPGASSPTVTGGSLVLLSRPTANFLLIKLNKHGIPQNYGSPNACSNCVTSVFENCSCCMLQYNDGTPGTTHTFGAVTTDFKGWDDAIFKLVIDRDARGYITAAGQASEDAPLQSMRTGLARYNIADGSLDRSFGTAGLSMINGGRNRRTLVRDAISAPSGQLLLAGQSQFADEVVTTSLFQDSTSVDFAVFSVLQ